MAGMAGLEPAKTSQGQNLLPYRLATPLYIFPQLVVPIRPSRTPYLSAILYSLEAFRLKGILICLSSFKLLRNWSGRRDSNPRTPFLTDLTHTRNVVRWPLLNSRINYFQWPLFLLLRHKSFLYILLFVKLYAEEHNEQFYVDLIANIFPNQQQSSLLNIPDMFFLQICVYLDN